MSLGLGVFLLVLGAIFVFALDVAIPGLEAVSLGWILILGGILAIVLSMVQSNSGRKRQTTAVREHSDGSQTVEERTTKDNRNDTV